MSFWSVGRTLFERRFRPLVFALYGILALWSGGLNAETLLTGPGTLNSEGEHYKLMNDITADGPIFTITANNVVLDLDGHTIAYSSSYGVEITASNVEVSNGKIVQSGTAALAHGIAVSGGSGGHNLHHLAIQVNGDRCRGISALFSDNIEIHHVYVEDFGETTDIAYAPDCIYVEARNYGGIRIYDNVVVQGHRGLNLNYIGLYNETPTQSNVYNNLIQPVRTPGTKWPVGISLAKARNTDAYNNQIVSDDARGIVCDGLGQGVDRGTDYCIISGNRIDVEYITPAGEGEYVENNVFGLYDRYSSGDNTFADNIVMVDNGTAGATAAVRIGSDAPDSLMVGLVVEDNVLIAREGSAFLWGVVEEVSVINNKYIADIFSENNWDANQHNINIGDEISVSGNMEIVLESYTPAIPTGLYLTKFFDSYLLKWDDNLDKGESQTYEYIVYRDGQRLPISPRGGTFYVDVDVGGTHTYSISSLTLSGVESPISSEVSTTSAVNGWWDEEEPSRSSDGGGGGGSGGCFISALIQK